MRHTKVTSLTHPPTTHLSLPLLRDLAAHSIIKKTSSVVGSRPSSTSNVAAESRLVSMPTGTKKVDNSHFEKWLQEEIEAEKKKKAEEAKNAPVIDLVNPFPFVSFAKHYLTYFTL